MSFQPLRGFRDYPPPEAGARSEIRRRMRSVARRSGFVELETPSVEALELFKTKSGDEIVSQLWSFTDKGSREVTLVAETTPSLARVFVSRAKSEPLPVKWFTFSKLWRYEEPQSGRTREFGQLNLDILGVPGVEAEVEILSTAALVMDEVGAKDLFSFHVNDRLLAEGMGRALGATDLPRFFRALDRSKKMGAPAFRVELAESGLSSERVTWLEEFLRTSTEPGTTVGRALEPLRELPLDDAATGAVARLTELERLGTAAGLGPLLAYDPAIVRGIAYYTTTVFEAVDRRGDLRSLFGGGRYDRLVELFGGPATPAVGLAIGDQTLELLLRENDRWPEGEPGLDTYVVAVSPDQIPLALEWVQRLRRAGVSADSDLLGRSLSRQLKEAARRKARRALILGPKELERGRVVERNLTTGAQRELAPNEVLPPA